MRELARAADRAPRHSVERLVRRFHSLFRIAQSSDSGGISVLLRSMGVNNSTV